MEDDATYEEFEVELVKGKDFVQLTGYRQIKQSSPRGGRLYREWDE